MAGINRLSSIIKRNYSVLIINQQNITESKNRNTPPAKVPVKNHESVWF